MILSHGSLTKCNKIDLVLWPELLFSLVDDPIQKFVLGFCPKF